MFDDAFLKALDEYVRLDIQNCLKLNLNNDAGKAVWNYDNGYDFWFGHTIGMTTRTAIQIFKDAYGKLPSNIESKAIIEKINEYSSQYKQAFEHLK